MKNISHVYETPPAGADTDWTVPQNWDRFSADEHAIWDTLFARQTNMLPARSADAFFSAYTSSRQVFLTIFYHVPKSPGGWLVRPLARVGRFQL